MRKYKAGEGVPRYARFDILMSGSSLEELCLRSHITQNSKSSYLSYCEILILYINTSCIDGNILTKISMWGLPHLALQCITKILQNPVSLSEKLWRPCKAFWDMSLGVAKKRDYHQKRCGHTECAAVQQPVAKCTHCKKGIVVWTSHLLSEWQMSGQITCMDSSLDQRTQNSLQQSSQPSKLFIYLLICITTCSPLSMPK